MGTQLPSPKEGQSPQFLAHVYCGQTAGWMKTPLGTEVDLGPGHFVLDGFPAIAGRGTAAPLFGPCLLWPRSPISATAELLYKVQCRSLRDVAQTLAHLLTTTISCLLETDEFIKLTFKNIGR